MEHYLGADIQLHSAVDQIEQIAGGWRVCSAKGAREHQSVLLAAPAHRLAAIKLDSDPEFSLKALGDIKYPPVVSVVFGFRRQDVEHPLDGFGVLIPEVEQLNILGAIFSSSLFPNRAPEGHVTITCYLGGCRNPHLTQFDQGTLRRLVLRDLGKILGVKGQPTFEHCAVFRQAIPQYEIGYGRFKSLMSQIEAASPGLYFAGHYRDGISLGDSVVSGENAAETITAGVQDSQARLQTILAP